MVETLELRTLFAILDIMEIYTIMRCICLCAYHRNTHTNLEMLWELEHDFFRAKGREMCHFDIWLKMRVKLNICIIFTIHFIMDISCVSIFSSLHIRSFYLSISLRKSHDETRARVCCDILPIFIFLCGHASLSQTNFLRFTINHSTAGLVDGSAQFIHNQLLYYVKHHSLIRATAPNRNQISWQPSQIQIKMIFALYLRLNETNRTEPNHFRWIIFDAAKETTQKAIFFDSAYLLWSL